jgi:hypothetical protein
MVFDLDEEVGYGEGGAYEWEIYKGRSRTDEDVEMMCARQMMAVLI